MGMKSYTTTELPVDDEVAVWGVPGLSIAEFWEAQEPDLIEDSIARSLRYLGVHIPNELVAREV